MQTDNLLKRKRKQNVKRRQITKRDPLAVASFIWAIPIRVQRSYISRGTHVRILKCSFRFIDRQTDCTGAVS